MRKLIVAPKPPAPPKPVEITKFDPPLPPPPIQASEAFEEADPLPPGPPQMNQPVGPPPEEAASPDTFDGYLALAKTSPNRMSAANKTFWATMASADAQDRIANHLGVIAEFLGAYETSEGPQLRDVLEELVSGKKRKK